MSDKEEFNSIEDEESSLTSVGDEQSRKKSGTGLLVKITFLLILVALVALAYVFVTKLRGSGDNVDQERPTLVQKPSSNTLPKRTFVLPVSPEPVIEPIKLRETQVARVENNVEAVSEKPVLNKSKPTLIAIRKGKENASTGSPARTSTANASGGLAESELSSSLAPTIVSQASAARLKDRNFILAKGAFINCVLKTKLDSSVAGMSSCIVTRDIYSDNGKVVLIEKGAEVTGEYRSKLNRGVSRIFVLWNRIKSPLGVVINIDSPATDSLGGSGLPGFIDTHFWQRFGGALLLSLVDDIAANIAANSNDGTIINSTSENSSSGAEIALENSIDIPPTLHINHGAKVGIYVARDLDFSSVYYVK